jgi:hypothetical protein
VGPMRFVGYLLGLALLLELSLLASCIVSSQHITRREELP